MRFTLIAEHDTGERITYEFDKEYLPDVLTDIDLFLRGCGYCASGQLEYVSEEVYSASDSLDLTGMDNNMNTTTDGIQHSGWYWDTERNK